MYYRIFRLYFFERYNIDTSVEYDLEVDIEESSVAYDEDDDYGCSGEKYGWYNGWSDDAIDDAFKGDPMNTWNVD